MSGFQRVQGERHERVRRAGSRRTIVTGGTGFIGAYVASQLLAQGREVLVLDVKDYAPEGRFVLGERLRDVSVERASVDDRSRLLDLVQGTRSRRDRAHGDDHRPGVLATNRTPGSE